MIQSTTLPSKSVAEQTRYVCQVTGKTYKTKRGARNSEARESVKLRQRNYARENASTLNELVDILVQKSKEFYGWDLVVHGVSDIKVIERSTNDLGLLFKLGFNLYPNKRVSQYNHIAYFLCDGFSGLQQYWTNWMTFREQNRCDRVAKADMFISFSDFPLIHEKYKEFLSLKEEKQIFLNKECMVREEAQKFTSQLPEYLEQEKLVSDIHRSLEEERILLWKIKEYNTQSYLNLWFRSEGPCPEIPSELDDMFSNHC